MNEIINDALNESIVNEQTRKVYALALMAEKVERVSTDAIDVVLLRAWERFQSDRDLDPTRSMRVIRRDLMSTVSTIEPEREFYVSALEYAIGAIVKRYAT